MPRQHVDAEVFMRVDLPEGRVYIYHTYRDDDPFNNSPSEIWYSLHPSGSTSFMVHKESGVFSLDDLPGLSEELGVALDAELHLGDQDKLRIAHAVRSGYFNDWPHFSPQKLPGPPDKNGNALLMKNHECPECGNSRRLRISVYTHVTVTDEGIEDYGDPCEGDLDWDEHSNVECPSCGHRAELIEFDLTERLDDEESP